MSDEWQIREIKHQSYVEIADDQGCPVAIRVYRDDAEAIVRDHNAALVARPEGTEDILRRRVWTLRPALELAVKRLRDVYPAYEQHHEGGEIWRVIEMGEQALAETSGPTPRPEGTAGEVEATESGADGAPTLL